MKLPTLTSTTAISHQNHAFTESAGLYSMQGGLQTQGIFDSILGGLGDIVGGVVGKIPCVLSKAGPKAVSCLASCGPNPACLAACAGPTAVTSILSCI